MRVGLALLFAVLAAPVTASFKPVPRAKTVVSSDGAITVTNTDTGKGGTMPAWITTLSWKDDKGAPRRQVFDDESGRLGWVESVGVFATTEGPVYVLVAEDKLATTSYELALRAFRRGKGGSTLEPVADFFPALREGDVAGPELVLEYDRPRGTQVFPRPLEARVEEGAGRVVVGLFPRWQPGSTVAEASPTRAFSLVLDGNRLRAEDLDDAERASLFPE